MHRALRVGMADDQGEVRGLLERMLCAAGHEVVFAVETGRQLVDRCAELRPDLVITDIRMPDLDGLDAARLIYEHAPTPVILLSGYSEKELIERAQENHVLSYLIKPISQPQLEAAILLVMRRFEELETLSRQAADLRQALVDRKLIERAKALVMRHWNVDEAEAFRRLQRLASSNNTKLVDVAQMILTAAEALQP